MMFKLGNLSSLASMYKPNLTSNRHFWAWLNIVFNIVDKKRVKEVGADRACAEWLVRNGGSVTFVGEEATTDYHSIARLPAGFHKQLQAIDATGASITSHGHLIGCKHVESIKLHKNAYVNDKAVNELVHVRDSLKKLEISSCEEVTDNGVKSVTQLRKLTSLTLAELSGVKDWTSCEQHLRSGLPDCNVNIAQPPK